MRDTATSRNSGKTKLMGNGRGITAGIEFFSGPWTDHHRLHLLRRTMLGIDRNSLEVMEELDLSRCIDQILQQDPVPPVPVNDYNDGEVYDANVPLGEPWIYDTGRENADIVSARVVSLKSWWIRSMLDHPSTIHEKMVFFWHNHFATQSWEVFWPHLTYYHFLTLREHALGNFKAMVKAITLDPHMLLYLNGALNRKDAPDENYGRELQELFCIGKGPQANYTEGDVQAAARVLTGHSIDWEKGGQYLYRWYWHDEADKQFSSFYDNQVIRGRSADDGAGELDDLLDMIFANNEVAAFMVRKLYRFFVYSDIDEDTELNVIQPLAEIFRDSGYEIKPVLETLLKSAHFYAEENVGAMIKTPLDFLIGFWRTGGVTMPAQANEIQKKKIRTSMLWTMNNIGLEVMDPPNVAGYPAYYQFPQYDRNWITTNTVTQRALITDSFIYWGFWSADLLTNIDLLQHVASLSQPEDPDKLIEEIAELHAAFPLSDTVKLRMKATLLTGQQNPYYWTSAWLDYVDNPQDEMKRMIVEIRLKVMFQFLMQLSEYHLM
ncbi:MAG: DUF1800 domain-containing protein [Saprospiraceae bacterium]|nr:DUF1800 domain-containing protein [Saprospiraceae bacterium]